MKKLTLIVSILYSITVLAGHDSTYKPQSYFSLKFGLTSMYITESKGSLSGSSKDKLGVVLGVGYEMEVNKYISVIPELNLISKGMYIDSKNDLTLAYVELPLHLVLKMPISNSVQIYGEGGGSIALGVGGSANIDGQKYKDVFGKDAYKSFDAGLSFGAGVNFILESKNKISFGARMYKGVQNFYPPNSQNITGVNNGIIFTFTYMGNSSNID